MNIVIADVIIVVDLEFKEIILDIFIFLAFQPVATNLPH